KDRFGHHRTYEEIIAEGALKEKTPLSKEAIAAWAQTSRDLHHFPRHLGLHSGGFVVSQYPLTDISPIEPATMENRSVIQWNKDDLDDLGMFKIDVLSLGMLTAVRKTFD